MKSSFAPPSAPGQPFGSGAKPERPQAGGSYRRRPDGTLERVEFTINVGEPGHPDQGPAGAPPAPVAPAPKPKEKAR